MMTLYLRGISMGMLFSPLTTVATLDVPREKMGQASGLINVLRQIGGSFGVALLTTILTSRIIFHSQHYGEALEMNSPVLRTTVSHLGSYAVQHIGSFGQMAEQQGRMLLLSNLHQQAFAQGIADDFLLAGIITLVSAIPVLFLWFKKKQP
jgi:DHA2 family multidrug resistance protein